MYDDHLYCDECGKHSALCYCFTYNPPEKDDPDEDVLRRAENRVTHIKALLTNVEK